ncbi:hypothetical protein [Chitinophaga varians]|uniref:hypothetical protein n=1 Tax=Chitinophaga varians TaxID=2202339 RepID=UPI00165F6CB4|nr:hypothetical protein [Chitinophaga varians]MBC9913178.1 hypothetical protein [Chitinophaga varians]
MNLMANISKRYEQRLLLMQRKLMFEMDTILSRSFFDLAAAASKVRYRDKVINIRRYPGLQKKVDEILSTMKTKVEITLVNGIEGAWGLSDQKNKIFVEQRFADTVPTKFRKQLYNSNLPAREKFINRVEDGMNLSDRVWNLTKSVKKELEAGIQKGLEVGKASNVFQKDLHNYLLNPKGHPYPGRGVYRSARANAFRLTRTETNMAYRTADYERWNSQPFVVGVQVDTSNNHPDYDICDELAGKYPKDFLFRGWHPQCRCHAKPILITSDEMDKYEDHILGIGKWDGESKNEVTKAPPEFYQYLRENKDKINRLSNTPYWVIDNKGYTALLNK